jgi:alkane 1-monooxygenase
MASPIHAAAATGMRALKPAGYLLAFVVPALMPVSAWLAQRTGWHEAAAWFPLLFLFVLLPLADYAIGRDASNPADAADVEALEARAGYRLLTLLALPVQLVLLAWSAWAWIELPLGPLGQAGWLLSQGIVSGTFGITVAHELIHKRGRLEPWTGGLLLATVGYGTFKVEHVRGHHVHVATPGDASSAPQGMSVYPFIGRALRRNAANAWWLEASRLRALGLPALHWRNELLWWSAATVAMALALGAWLGAAGVAFFAAQALLAICTLETINYIEHYGLARRRSAEGRYERPTHLHSWNSNYLLSNLMLFQLQRHSDHHESARRRYQALVHHEASPQLPGGYASMFLLALCPPLWFRVIDPRVRAFEARSTPEPSL